MARLHPEVVSDGLGLHKVEGDLINAALKKCLSPDSAQAAATVTGHQPERFISLQRLCEQTNTCVTDN